MYSSSFSSSSSSILQFILTLFILLLLLNSIEVQCRKKKLRHGKTNRFSVNKTIAQVREVEFKRWVNSIRGLRHTTFNRGRDMLLPSFSITVDKNPCKGDFKTIQAAIDSLPLINIARVVIRVHAGTYREKVNISPLRAFITIQGAGADKTVIQWGDTAQTLGANGKPMGTFNSATFAINAPYFIAKNITFKNTNSIPKPGEKGLQAVALRISGDRAAFVGCKFLGAQDTLYDHVGKHYYKDCYIEGSVDFIFGNALSLFEGCHVHAIAEKYGALTAQNRMSFLENTGFSFLRCRVTGSGVLYLGRAWGYFSRVVFAYTYMDNIIIPRGWNNWGDPQRQMAVFYGQYKCTGAGANHGGRVSWSRELTDEEAKPFISLNFIDGLDWIKL
ncbi:probable pectinesterase 53 [Dioscorea cayenensis subsp. rotundata]|uniref:Pectinesterase n=1 Tax=Dioscorea cayennensis subsp. rotundata TaxID=55577 RepID=A0AB40AW76_DIOCR|nr:probable pectinesterase 53 [Dioscorea cayenensis subsp. rotundata]